MAQNIPVRTKWTPPPARIEGDRLLKARAAEQRVRNAAVQTKAQEERTKEILGQELGTKVEKLEDTVDRLIDNLPRIVPNGGGGGRKTIERVFSRYYPDLPGLPENALWQQTKTSLAAKTMPAHLDAIALVGDVDAGDDNDGQPILLKRDPDATVGYITDAAATKFAYNSRTVRLSKALWGFDQSDATGVANRTAIVDALTYLRGKGGGRIIVPKGVGLLSSRITNYTLACDIDIEGEPGAELKAVSGFTLQMLNLAPRQVFYQVATPTATSTEDLWFDAAVTDVALGTCRKWNGSTWEIVALDGDDIYYPATLRTDGIRWDCSLGVDNGAGQYVSPVAAAYFRNWFAERNIGYSGDAYASGGGDSLFSPVACFNFEFENNDARGFRDVVYYVGGDNKLGSASGDGAGGRVSGGYCENNNSIGVTKRELRNVIFDGIRGKNNSSGFLTYEVGTGLAGSGREMHVRNCVLDGTRTRNVEFRGPGKGSVIGNTFRDWGTGGTGQGAILAVGASEIDVSNNLFELRNQAEDNQYGMIISSATIDGVLYTGGNINGHGNTYRGLERCVAESGTVVPSIFENEVLDSPVGINAAIWFTLTNAASRVSYSILGETAKRFRQNSVNYRENPALPIAQPAGGTLVADDSGKIFTNAGATARADFVLPAAEISLVFRFLSIDADGIQITAAAGDVIRINGSVSTGGGTATNTGAVGTYLELVCIDGTNWVATSVVGTWTLA